MKSASRTLVAAFTILLPLSRAYAAPGSASWLFGVAPRQTGEGRSMAPLAQLIARAAGHAVTVWHPVRSWFVYANDAVEGRFALTLDGATFTGWRDRHRGYHPLVRLSGRMRFLVLTPRDSRLRAVRGVDGAVVCASPLPNMATMELLAHTSRFTPPYIAPMGGVKQDYQGLVSGKCQATIVPSSFFQRIPPHARASLRVLYRTHSYPNLTLSAGPQVPASLRRRIRHALLSPQGEALAAHLFPGRHFVVPTPGAYQPYAHDLSRMTFFQAMVTADSE